jgi:hypothetical protein
MPTAKLTANQGTKRAFWEAPWTFFIEVLTGTLIFLVIAAAAVGLNLILHKLEEIKIDLVLIYGLRGAEYLLFGADLLLFLRFLYLTTVHTWKRLA